MKNKHLHSLETPAEPGVIPEALDDVSCVIGEPRVVSGMVTQADSEVPCADVLVTDGYAFTRTDEQGRFQLEVDPEARWVLVINPSGYQPDASQYMLLSDESRSTQADVKFTLKPMVHPADEPFTFVHMSDSHVASPYRAQRMCFEYVQAINGMTRRPAFVLDTGDLCINSPEQLEAAAEAIAQYDVPYLATIGNHDLKRQATFERLFRPNYHAFTCHQYLIISLPWGPDARKARVWMRQLLEAFGESYHVLVALHHPEGLGDQFDAYMEMFKAWKVQGLFVGHYHTPQVYNLQGIPVYMVRGAVARNADAGRPSFHLIEAHRDGQLRIESREVDHHRELSLIAPDKQGKFQRSVETALWVSAYDTAMHVKEVHVFIHESSPQGRLLAKIPLKQCNDFLWSAELTPREDWPGRVYLHIEAVDETDERWNPVHVLRSVVDSTSQDHVNSVSTAKSDGATPTLAWVQGVPGSFGFSNPVLRDGVLYIGVEYVTEAQRSNPILVAMDAVTGDLIWQYHACACSVRTTPLVTDQLVVVQTDDGNVHAVDRRNGQRVWVQPCMQIAGANQHVYFRASPVAVGRSDVITGSVHLYSRLSLEDGQPIWQPEHLRGVRSTAPATPVVAGEMIITAQKNSLQALHADSGTLCWERFFKGVHTTPVVIGQVLYVLVYGQEQANSLGQDPWSKDRWRVHVVALDLATGQTIWDSQLQHYGETLSSPVVMGDSLVIVDYDTLIGVDIATGATTWRISFAEALSEREYLIANDMCSAARYPDANDGLVVGAPAVDKNRIYLVSRTGTVIAMQPGKDRPVWRYALDTTVVSTPVVADHVIYVTGSNGACYALTQGRPAIH